MAAAAAAPATALAAQAPSAKPTPPTIEEFLKPDVLLDVDLSPDGLQLAVLRVSRENGKHTAYLRLAKSAEMAADVETVALGDHDAYVVQWANNERLLVSVSFDKDEYGHPTGMFYDGVFFAIPVRRVVSIDRSGKDMVVLFGSKKSVMQETFDLATIVDLLPGDDRHILMQAWDAESGAYALYKVDVYTGSVQLMEHGSPETDTWATQNGVPVLRYDSNQRGTVFTVLARAPGEKSWKVYRRLRRNELKKFSEFDVVGGAQEPGVLLVSARGEGEDFHSIRKFDIHTLEFGDVVARSPQHELDGVFTDMNQRLIGCSYTDDRRGYVFTDPTLNAHFSGVNRFFENSCNVTLYDANLTHDRFVLKVTGPQQPGAFYLYDRLGVHIEPLGDVSPWLTPDRLAKVEIFQVKTRGGGAITAYLTTPINTGPGPLPMVVVPHGGPEMRDRVDFDLFAQVLAAQGWLVLQPNFRGSGGYGKAFADLGRKHWGDRMQDDVDDAVAQVIAAGRADPKRVAIWGASYGGYTALMQAVLKPNLYKAVVAIAGDCLLSDTLDFSRHEDGADSPTYAYWLASIGDPKTDAEMLKAASPALRAAEITAPVLLIHGTKDKIVDPKQSKIMAKALKAAGKTYEYVELKGEGHRDWARDTYQTVLERSTAFIAKYI